MFTSPHPIERIYVRVMDNMACQSVDLYVMDRSSPDHVPGEIPRPTAQMSYNMAHTLMDDLWRAGIRPTEGKVSDKTLEAKDKHLDDLRTVLFHKLGVARGG